MSDICLHPSGILTFDSRPIDSESPTHKSLSAAFNDDWRRGLFTLSAITGDLSDISVAARFWRMVGGEFLTRLCHQRPEIFLEDNPLKELATPSFELLTHWIHIAPPMTGGEYITDERLDFIWDELGSWTWETLRQYSDIEGFLSDWAPAWNRVGRVTFHLAENKQSAQLPFAFLATFTTGLGSGGKIKHLPLQQALKLYAGTRNKQALVKLLSPVREAAAGLSWVQEMVNSGRVYQPAAWTAAQAYQLLKSTPELEAAGLSVRVPEWSKKSVKPSVKVTINRKNKTSLGIDSVLEMNVEVMLGDDRISSADLENLLSQGECLVSLKGQWVEIDGTKLQEVLEYWQGIEVESESGGLSFHEGLRLLAGTSANLESVTNEDVPHWSEVVAGSSLQKILEDLRNPQSKHGLKLGNNLQTILRPYQNKGVAWLHLLAGLGLGACLADDMGLGKTIQILALLNSRRRKKSDPPALLIIPASLLGNWKAEAARFTPELKLLMLHTAETPRKTLNEIGNNPQDHLGKYDLVITTYAMTHRLPWLSEQQWHLIILDEAQAIKNYGTRQSRAVRKLNGSARIALTGTPVENNLGDLWSLFSFLNPGLLGSKHQFASFVKEMEKNGFEPLRKLVGPYILRRMKTDKKIISDLPEKTETIRYCTLTRTQIKLYSEVVTKLQNGLAAVNEGIERRGLVLGALMRLKQVCNHPSQVNGDGQYAVGDSGKFQRLEDICGELAQRQEKALVFTQYREIIPALEEHLAKVFGRPGLVLHGGTSVGKRQKLVTQFQREDSPPFFVISLKAGGTGLNLTEACHVIHFDRWWNPAVENQATDRAFRIGQKKNVLVHKFVTTGTIEEKIDLMINEKKELANQVLGGREIKLTELSDERILELVQLDITRAKA